MSVSLVFYFAHKRTLLSNDVQLPHLIRTADCSLHRSSQRLLKLNLKKRAKKKKEEKKHFTFIITKSLDAPCAMRSKLD